MPGPLDLSTRPEAVAFAEDAAREAVRAVRRWLTPALGEALEALALDALLFHPAARRAVAREALAPTEAPRRAAQLARDEVANDVTREARRRPPEPREQALVRLARQPVERLARFLAHRAGGDAAELAQIGLEALVAAAATWTGAQEAFRGAGLRVARDAMRYAQKKEVRLKRRSVSAWSELPGEDPDTGPTAAADLASAFVTAELLALVPQAWGAEGALLARQALEGLARARAGLPEIERRLLEGMYDEGRELKELARALGLGYATAKRRHQAALVALHAALAR